MRTRSLFALVLAVGLIGAACAGPAASPTAVATTPAATTAAATAAATTPASSPTSAAGGETVAVADSSLGKILVDSEGRTLYGFTNDKDGVPTCYEGCKPAWPPLLAEGAITVGAGLTASDFTTVDRTDSGKQVKVGDWPLYRFAQDTAPGDTKGQGVGGIWFVVGQDGELIKQ
jgi:predicted lipoprotein with Yx(FWY)xxD motif